MVARRPNILILNAQVPFTRGGAEALTDCLRMNLERAGTCVDVVQLPFAAEPKTLLIRQMAIWRALDLSSFAGRKVDLVIGTKFPSYLAPHPFKTIWLIHQHRQLYELYGSRFGDFSTSDEDETLRQLVYAADREALAECKTRYTISGNVSARLARYLGLDSTPLPPPLPLGDRYYSAASEDYILSVGRLCSIKRVDLIIRALPQINPALKLKIVGLADEPAIDTYLRSEIEKHHLAQRVEFLGRVADEKLLDLYARAFAVYYGPYDEDYGFVTIEALASGKPVVTCRDSGSVLEFVSHEVNGLVAEPDEASIAAALSRLYDDAALYTKLVSAPRPRLTRWPEVVAELTRGLD